jgi:hypothetical protein
VKAKDEFSVAQRLAEALEAVEKGSSLEEVKQSLSLDEELMACLEAAQSLKNLGDLSFCQVEAGFKAKLAQQFKTSSTISKRPLQRALLLAAAFLLALTGTAFATQQSLPGSFLYPIKRLVEKSEVILAPTRSVRQAFQKAQAAERLREAQRIEAHYPEKAKQLRQEAQKHLGSSKQKVKEEKLRKKSSKSQPHLKQNRHENDNNKGKGNHPTSRTTPKKKGSTRGEPDHQPGGEGKH